MSSWWMTEFDIQEKYLVLLWELTANKRRLKGKYVDKWAIGDEAKGDTIVYKWAEKPARETEMMHRELKGGS